MDLSHDTDILAWSQTQAALLRRAARGERVNGIDWDLLAEEIEAMGNSELKAVESLWLQAMLHLIKLALLSEDQAAMHWRLEVTSFLVQAEARYLKSMRQRIDLDKLWRRCRVASAQHFGDLKEFAHLPDHCPWTIETLLEGDIKSQVRALRQEPH